MTNAAKKLTFDVHMHLAGIGCCNSGCWISPTFQKRFSFRALKFLQRITEKQMRESIDLDWAEKLSKIVAASPIDYGVALGFDGFYSHQTGELGTDLSQMIIPPEWVFRVCRTFKNLLPGPSINPHRADALKRLEYCMKEGAVLIKWLPPSQAINPQHPSLRDFYRILADAKVPLLVHMGGERTFATIAEEYNDVKLLRAPLEAGVKVICAHSATRILGTKEHDQIPTLKAMLQEFPHFWVDNSGLCNPGRFAHAPRLAADPIVASRTVYGSDWPVPSNASYYIIQLGIRKTLKLERLRNPVERDVATKSAIGYNDATWSRANEVLGNLDRWIP